MFGDKLGVERSSFLSLCCVTSVVSDELSSQLGVPENLSMTQFVKELRAQKEYSETDIYCGNGPIEKVDADLLKDVVRLLPNLPGDSGNLWMVMPSFVLICLC